MKTTMTPPEPNGFGSKAFVRIFTFMMLFVILLALLLHFSSCTVIRDGICPPTTITHQVHTTVKDTTIFFYVPPEHETETIFLFKTDTIWETDTIFQIETVPIDLPYTSFLQTDICESRVVIDTGFVIDHDVWQREVDQEVLIPDAIKETVDKETKFVEVERDLTFLQRARLRMGDIFLMIIAALVTLGVVRRKFPFSLTK